MTVSICFFKSQNFTAVATSVAKYEKSSWAITHFVLQIFQQEKQMETKRFVLWLEFCLLSYKMHHIEQPVAAVCRNCHNVSDNLFLFRGPTRQHKGLLFHFCEMGNLKFLFNFITCNWIYTSTQMKMNG